MRKKSMRKPIIGLPTEVATSFDDREIATVSDISGMKRAEDRNREMKKTANMSKWYIPVYTASLALFQAEQSVMEVYPRLYSFATV